MSGAVTACRIAEALAAIALFQYVRPGCRPLRPSAPFTPQRRDMALPARRRFGTPEYIAGDARLTGQRWRRSLRHSRWRLIGGRATANVPDVAGDVGDLQIRSGRRWHSGGRTLVYHAAGWLRGEGWWASPENVRHGLRGDPDDSPGRYYFEPDWFSPQWSRGEIALETIRGVGSTEHYSWWSPHTTGALRDGLLPAHGHGDWA